MEVSVLSFDIKTIILSLLQHYLLGEQVLYFNPDVAIESFTNFANFY